MSEKLTQKLRKIADGMGDSLKRKVWEAVLDIKEDGDERTIAQLCDQAQRDECFFPWEPSTWDGARMFDNYEREIVEEVFECMTWEEVRQNKYFDDDDPLARYDGNKWLLTRIAAESYAWDMENQADDIETLIEEEENLLNDFIEEVSKN